MEIVEDLAGSNDHSMVIKGKRTKRRQRPSSPGGCRPVAVTSSSSSGGGGEDGEVLGYFYPLIPSSATSTSDISTTGADQEDDDQDIANCLILLAQGESGRKPVHHRNHQHHKDVEIKMEKFSSRRFNEMVSSSTGGKVGFFVYECKTCNRTFPSFQALGGHRASHKKPKITTMEEKKTAILTPPPPPPPQTTNDQQHHHHEVKAEKYVEVKEEQARESGLERNTGNPSCNNKAKNHECSICGAEFSSGQALGGHMRRHRNPPPMSSTTNATKVSMIVDQTSPSSSNDDLDEASQFVKKPRNNIFPLDLNLPAPAEDDNHHRELKFQQLHLVFTAPALVDCHY